MTRKLALFSDFKAFINKGNVVDLAIAVVIAGAFGKVVGSVVTLITTNALEPALKAANVDSINAWPAESVIVAILNFLVIAFVCFLIVKTIEASKHKQEVAAETKPTLKFNWLLPSPASQTLLKAKGSKEVPC
jgi:large conductance mechanosensitive channel